MIESTNYDEYAPGKGVTLSSGFDIAIIAAGPMVRDALEAANMLNRCDVFARVIDMHTVWPIDKDLVLRAARETGCIVTVEEHSGPDSLGDAVESIVGKEEQIPILRYIADEQMNDDTDKEEIPDNSRIARSLRTMILRFFEENGYFISGR